MPAPHPDPSSATYAERLWPPAWLWLVAVLGPLMLAVAYGYALGMTVGLVVGVSLTLLVVAGLFKVSVPIVVTSEGLSVGGAFLETRYFGSVAALDAVKTRHVIGPGADARAFAVVRGWVRESVRLGVDDPRDPTPYWLVSTRHANLFAEACKDPSQQSKEV